ncbi:hypothetical protein D3C87_1976520 [compost metagenome]
MAGKRERRKAGLAGLDAQLLVELADQRGLGRFPMLYLAAREFPKARHGLTFRALGDEDAPVGIDKGAGNNEQDWFCGQSGAPGMR